MDVSFGSLDVGSFYSRPYLAELWQYRGVQALSRGVIMPRNSDIIILFVTKIKQRGFTQYNDYINNGFLFWEGEKKHSSDQAIINAAEKGRSIKLFYREIHHSDFLYCGNIDLVGYKEKKDNPSQFVFSVNKEIDDLSELKKLEVSSPDRYKGAETEREQIIKSRVGQGLFRQRLFDLWGGCAVTGISEPFLMRASHIRPWRLSDNEQRLDPRNGLLLIPNLDHLFDAGYLTFDDCGRAVISNALSVEHKACLGLSEALRLRKIPEGSENYLSFHREKVFNQ